MSAKGLWLVSSVGSNGEGKSGQAGDDVVGLSGTSQRLRLLWGCVVEEVCCRWVRECVCVSPPAEDSDKGWGIFVKK